MLWPTTFKVGLEVSMGKFVEHVYTMRCKLSKHSVDFDCVSVLGS